MAQPGPPQNRPYTVPGRLTTDNGTYQGCASPENLLRVTQRLFIYPAPNAAPSPSAMTTKDDLDKALRELDVLTAALSAEVRDASDEQSRSAPMRLRKEALMTTRILVSKLEVVRALENPPWTDS